MTTNYFYIRVNWGPQRGFHLIKFNNYNCDQFANIYKALTSVSFKHNLKLNKQIKLFKKTIRSYFYTVTQIG